MDADKAQFLNALEESLAAGTFVRLALAKPAPGTAETKCDVTRVVVQERPHLKRVTHRDRRDFTDTTPEAEAIASIGAQIGTAYLSATLFTTAKDIALVYSRKMRPQLTTRKATYAAAPEASHDRAKTYQVDPGRPYLEALGITHDKGRVKPTMYGKFRQICHFIEIVDGLVAQSALKDAESLSAIDFGSGKGYLTFALYDHLTSKRGKACRMTGIDVRDDLVTFCQDLGNQLALTGLTFEAIEAAKVAVAPTDLLIALHACDTATDDAIHYGIAAGAQLIVTAPCCQHEIAAQLGKPADGLHAITRFGLLRQRQADLITDAARALLLEAMGYKVRIIEFASPDHTAKNLLIAGTKTQGIDRKAALAQYKALKAEAGFSRHHLEVHLAAALASI